MLRFRGRGSCGVGCCCCRCCGAFLGWSLSSFLGFLLLRCRLSTLLWRWRGSSSSLWRWGRLTAGVGGRWRLRRWHRANALRCSSRWGLLDDRRLLRHHGLATLLRLPAPIWHPVGPASRDRLAHLRTTERRVGTGWPHAIGALHTVLHVLHEELRCHFRGHLAGEIHRSGRSTALHHRVGGIRGTRETGLRNLGGVALHLIVGIWRRPCPTALGRSARWHLARWLLALLPR